MAIDAILFDKDGTLIDFQASWGGWAADMLAELTHDRPELTQPLADRLGVDLIGREILPGSIMIAGTPLDICQEIVATGGWTDVDELTRWMVDTSKDVAAVALTGLHKSLQQLRDMGLILGVATNDAIAPTQRQLNGLDIAHHFDFVAGFDSGHGAKPDPGPCLAFAHAIAVEPAQCAMVGDSLHDLHAGRAAGMLCVGVSSGPATTKELSCAADIVLPSIVDLPDWLRATAARSN